MCFLACALLETELPDLLRRRTTDGDAGRFALFGERCVLRQEAITGNDRLGAALASRSQNQITAQVTVGGAVAAETDGLVADTDMGAVAVGIGVDRHRADAQGAQGTGDAYCDLAAVGNEYGSEHVRFLVQLRRAM